MAHRFLDIASTPNVLAAQERFFGRAQAVPPAPADDALGDDEAAFIGARDSFYMSSVSETGWPYVQHRGGPPGFLKVLSRDSLAFADYKGNRQMLTTGNLTGSDRVCLFLMDYPHRQRLKILGRAEILDARDDTDLVAQITEPEMVKITERIVRIRVVGFDWNCPKYITPRFTAAEVNELIVPLKNRIAELESQITPDQP